MIESRREKAARELAEHWHSTQFDKLGVPYTSHLRHVARGAGELAISLGLQHLSHDCRAAGWLHDIFEDTDVPWPVVMRVAGPFVGRAVMALSHIEGEPNATYFRRVAEAGWRAVVPKWADITHNTLPERMIPLRVHQPSVFDRMYAALPRKLDTFASVMAEHDLRGPWSSEMVRASMIGDLS